AALLDDDATVDAGIELASATSDEGIVKALARRLATSTALEQRKAIVMALGQIDAIDALRALAAFVKDPALASDVAHAIATSPNTEAMRVIEKTIADAKTSTLGVRAYVARNHATGEKSAPAEDAIDSLRGSRDGSRRALGVFAALVTGKGDLDTALNDRDARVRRAAVLAMQDARFAGDRKKLYDRLPKETDEATRELSAILLLDPDARSHVSTLALAIRAKSGAADAALSAYARAARKAEGVDDAIAQELASPDAITRAHAARGLGESGAPDATGLLATAYKEETETEVRRAIVLAIASATPADSVSRVATLQLASSLDPDPTTRLYAVRGLSALPPASAPEITDVAWLHVETSDGTPPPAGMMGSVLRSDGFALPVVFDDEGYALVPSMPPGPARLVLAPRFAPDKDAPREKQKPSP
ncbi:MAG: HEAT repeat domain-containing protein, partial [Polyangiaceae bacterium]